MIVAILNLDKYDIIYIIRCIFLFNKESYPIYDLD